MARDGKNVAVIRQSEDRNAICIKNREGRLPLTASEGQADSFLADKQGTPREILEMALKGDLWIVDPIEFG